MDKIIKEYELNKKANDLLLNVLKMKDSCIGTCYWIYAITFYITKEMNNGCRLRNINEVYRYIANKYNTSVDCVEKAMRYAKEQSKYQAIMQSNKKMKNWELLIFCAEKIKMFFE